MSLITKLDEEKEIEDDNSELREWLKQNDLLDIEETLSAKKYTVVTFKYLNDSDIDAVIDDLKLTIPQKMRFKAAIKQLSATPRKKSRHYKNTKSEYVYSVDLNDFYSTTQTITIIGGSRVGKSSLKDVIVGRKFDENKFPTIKMKEQPELYISKIKRMRSQSSAHQSEKEITARYHIWDCPGQKALENIPPLYITGAMAVLIVYDITDKVTWNRAKEWMHYLRDEAKGYDKVMVCGNKKDKFANREVTLEEANDYCLELGYAHIQTSAKTGIGINTLQKWLDAHTQNKVEKKVQEYEENDQDEWKNERIRLDVLVEKEEEEETCCNF